MTIGFRDFLLEELARRQKRNALYSMNAFARDLGFSSSRLSEILNTKVGISESRAADIAEKLHLSDSETKYFIDLVQSEHGRSLVTKELARARLRERTVGARRIKQEEFFLVTEWQIFALLELLNVKNISHTIESFAQFARFQ